jgi:DNA-directed RNA polymerase specialized sigma24 family protein
LCRLINDERLTTSDSACRMREKELEKVSQEDLEGFQVLVADFYKRPWGESYELLRGEIKRRLFRRVGNSVYGWRFRSEADDLITRIVFRYSIVYGSMRRAGVSLDSFEAMLEDRVRLVFHESLRRYSKDVPVFRPDGDQPEPSAVAAHVDRTLEDEEQRARLNKCMLECLRKLPEHSLRLLAEYHDADDRPQHERTRMRLMLALREAGIPPDRAMPEQEARALRNLRVAISKLKNDRLKPCMEGCMRAQTSPHVAAGR